LSWSLSQGAIPVKGLATPIDVHELTGVSAVRSRLHASAARGLTRFVGRDAELEQLRRAQDQAAAGHGQIVAVVGEPGVGKSRLFHQFTRSHRTQAWLLLEAGSVSYGKAASYLPVIDLLRSYFKIHDRDSHRDIREKVTGKLLALDRALEPTLGALLALLDVPGDDAQWQPLDPSQRRQRTLEAVKRLLLRESQVQPLIVVFEDLHWIDSETQALLESLTDSLPTARLLLLVNYRPEYQHGWGGKTYYRQLRIDPLLPDSADELLDALLGTDPRLAPLKRLLTERTGGNPFFLEESVRALVESEALEGERGAYRITHPVEAIQVPATVQAILAARIDRLPPDEKNLLQSASVIGTDVPLALLQAITGLPAEALWRSLATLQAAEFLYEARLFPDLEYTFKHALTHEVAYGSLLHDRRRTLHTQIAETIERLYVDRLGEQIERLAHHAFKAERWPEAAEYLRQAGIKAAARSANREAAVHFDEALSALAHLPSTRETRERAVDLRLGLRNALHAMGEFRRTLTPLREAEALAEVLEDQPRLGRVCACLSQYYRLVDDLDQAVAFARRALDLGEAHHDFVLQIVANVSLGQSYHARGDFHLALDALRVNVASLREDQRLERFGQVYVPASFCRAWMARCLAELGEFGEARAKGEEAVQIAEEAAHPFSLTTACYALGVLRVLQGDLSEALPVLKRAFTLCEDWGFRSWMPPIASSLGTAHVLAGDHAAGLALLERAVDQAQGMALMGRQSLRLTRLGEAYLLADRTGAAMDTAVAALAAAREHKERAAGAWALRLLGDVMRESTPLDAPGAGARYEQARVLAEELNMRPLVAHCHLGLGTLDRRTGRRESAREHFAVATTMYRAMDMRFWLLRAEAEMKKTTAEG